MSGAVGALRSLARALLRYAMRVPTDANPVWNRFLERQLERIGNDMEAVIWAVGCLWALRVERLIRRVHPSFNGALFLCGLYLGVNILMPHLSWYGFPAAALESAGATPRVFARVAIFIACVAMVGVATSGNPRRRIFCACAFPLLGLWAWSAAAIGMDLTGAICLPPECVILELTVRGLVFGLLLATAVALPASLLYRGEAAPLAALALIPAVARADWAMAIAHPADYASADFFWQVWPFMCALALVAISAHVCYRWQVRQLGGAARH